MVLDPFVPGVVCDDRNEDGVYTAGEAVDNVAIRTLGTGHRTTTALAGGYGMPRR